jgi:L-threonylcarbamoyladenylate synthase
LINYSDATIIPNIKSLVTSYVPFFGNLQYLVKMIGQDIKKCIEILRQGGTAIIPTDTVYGLVACALDTRAVEKVYAVKGRAPDKPCIILIGASADIEKFSVIVTDAQRKILTRLWPNKISIRLLCNDNNFKHLHVGTNSLAFRIPNDQKLLEIIERTGPLVAPSANPGSLPTATTIQEAFDYFGSSVDYHLDGGTIVGTASTLINLADNGDVTILRQGELDIRELL